MEEVRFSSSEMKSYLILGAGFGGEGCSKGGKKLRRGAGE